MNKIVLILELEQIELGILDGNGIEHWLMKSIPDCVDLMSKFGTLTSCPIFIPFDEYFYLTIEKTYNFYNNSALFTYTFWSIEVYQNSEAIIISVINSKKGIIYVPFFQESNENELCSEF